MVERALFAGFIPGAPKAQPRIKATAVNGYARVYTPDTADEWKATVADAVHQQELPKAALYVSITFMLPRPKRLMRKSDADGPLAHMVKPDIDNLVKAVMDACNGELWEDDAQVVRLRAEKFYSAKDGVDGVYLHVSEYK